TPPPSYNFASIPRIDRPGDQLDPAQIGPMAAGGQGYLGFTRNNDQETLGVDMASAEVDHVIILPRRSYLPLWTAMATGSFFVAMLFGLYWLAPIAVLATTGLFLLWPRSLGQKEDFGQIDIGRGERAPLDAEVPD